MDLATSAWFLPIAGLLAGIVLGYAARRQHFCTMSAFERHWYAGDSTGLRTWVLAAAVATAATQALHLAGYADIGSSFYLSEHFAWSGAIIGGIAFGFGMALVGTCGFGALVRCGGGSLRSFVVLIVLGLSALAAQRGLIAHGRIRIVDNVAADLSFAGDQSLGSVLSALTGVNLRVPAAALVTAGMLWWVFRDRTFRRKPGRIAGGAVIGAVIAFGWFATTIASRNAFEPVQIKSASFVAPVGDAILQVVTFTGTVPDYGVGLVIGVVIGAAICAIRRRDVRWEACDDARELSRHMAGGFLMGVGGVFAMGCTIGQGMTAVSALALSAPLVMASIALGARMGLDYLVEGTPFSIFRPAFRSPG